MNAPDKAKAYQRKKQALSLFHLGLTPAVFAAAILTPLSAGLKEAAQQLLPNAYGALAVYFLFLSLYILIFDFPFSVYSGFFLEHRFNLSNQKFGGWFGEFLKGSVLSFIFSAALIEGLYALIWYFPDKWWLFAWAGFAVVSYVIGKIFPVFIVPLFYKYGKVDNEALKEKIFALSKRYGLPIENVYSLNLSKTTKKANAAFMGIGRTKRVVLSDTLLENFTDPEIEIVVAHELGHFKHGDIWRNLIFGLITSLLTFWLAFKLMDPVARYFGFQGVRDIAAMPLLFLISYVFSLVLTPVQNGFSRWMENAADVFALEAMRTPQIFISSMEKLASVNLADPEPNPVYEWFFYNHPAIAKRIRMAREWSEKR